MDATLHSEHYYQLKDELMQACINRLTPTQAQEILDEMPELTKKGFPDEWSANEKLWSYTE